MTLRILFFAAFGIVLLLVSFGEAADNEIPRMEVEMLKDLLDDEAAEADTNLLILDVRTGSSWTSSKSMIKTAVRANPADFTSWAAKYPQDKTFVLYCT